MDAPANDRITSKVRAIKFQRDHAPEELTECVAVEELLQIVLNDQLIATLACSPVNLRELAVGYLISEGIIGHIDSVSEPTQTDDGYTVTVKVSARRLVDQGGLAKRVLTSGCAGGRSSTQSPSQPLVVVPVTVRREQLAQLVSRMADSSQVFQQTGGVHSAALCTSEEILFCADDIGRHNAVDKVIGWAVLNNIDLKDKLLVSTGRISAEIVLKAARSRITIVASRGAPTSRALNLARGLSLTVIGFVRGRRMTVYTCSDRCSD